MDKAGVFGSDTAKGAEQCLEGLVVGLLCAFALLAALTTVPAVAVVALRPRLGSQVILTAAASLGSQT